MVLIKHTLVPSYHPQSNGPSERSVWILKEASVKQVIEDTKDMSIEHNLSNDDDEATFTNETKFDQT